MKHYIAISMIVFTAARTLKANNWSRHNATNFIRNCVRRHDIPISNEHMRRLIVRAYS